MIWYSRIGTINAPFKTSLTLCIQAIGPFHLLEHLERRLTHAFRRHDFGIVAHNDHGPHGLCNMGNPFKKQGPQNPTALVAVNSVTVLLFCQKAKTTKTVRAFNPTHRERWRADKFPMDGYLPISWLVRQPIGAQRGYEPILLFVDGVAHGEALATLGATTAQNSTTPTVFHTGAETMLVGALTIMRLECSFHCSNLY